MPSARRGHVVLAVAAAATACIVCVAFIPRRRCKRQLHADRASKRIQAERADPNYVRTEAARRMAAAAELRKREAAAAPLSKRKSVFHSGTAELPHELANLPTDFKSGTLCIAREEVRELVWQFVSAADTSAAAQVIAAAADARVPSNKQLLHQLLHEIDEGIITLEDVDELKHAHCASANVVGMYSTDCHFSKGSLGCHKQRHTIRMLRNQSEHDRAWTMRHELGTT
jgi:hypothetical protein